MPKVFLTSKDRAINAAHEADQALRVAVATRMMRDRLTQKALADRIGLTPVTLSRRTDFRIGEMRVIQGIFCKSLDFLFAEHIN